MLSSDSYKFVFLYYIDLLVLSHEIISNQIDYMSIKVLRITTEINRSSIGRTTEQLGQLVIDEGWESYIAWGRSDGKSKSHKLQIGNKWTVWMHGVITRLFDLHGYGSYFATKKLVKQIREINPNIIHLHDIHGYYINLKVLFSYLQSCGIPVVWTHHDCWAFTGHCAFYSSINCNKWQTECHQCPLYKEYPGSLFVDNSRRNFRLKKKLFTSLDNLYNVGVSKWISKELKKSFLNKYPIMTICNGIDTDVFRPMQECSEEVRLRYNIGKEKILLGVATAWSERKGLSDYYKLREKLNEEYVIVMVGVAPSLKESLPSGIIGIQRTDSIEELCKLYSAATIVLNLASAESFGKTTPEGLACGVPSIVYNCTASPDLVDMDTGIVVEKGNINALINAVNEISSWDKQKTVQNCRDRAINLYSIKKNWPQYIGLYKKILNEVTNRRKPPVLAF